MSRRTIYPILLMLGTVGMVRLGAAQGGKLSEDLPTGTMQQKATTACLECHEARIILQQRLSKAAWAKEVDKMVKWGAVVDTNDRDALIDYLSINFSPKRPPYAPVRTSAQKTAVKQTAK